MLADQHKIITYNTREHACFFLYDIFLIENLRQEILVGIVQSKWYVTLLTDT
jgi:hypothetical protein